MTDLNGTIARAVQARADRIVSTLCDLVAFPSIVKNNPSEAGPGERDCQLYLQKRLEALGFTTDLWDPDGPALYEKYKGRPGANKGRTFEGPPQSRRHAARHGWRALDHAHRPYRCGAAGRGRPLAQRSVQAPCRKLWPAPSASGFSVSGLICLHKRIRPSGEPLAKMESRASWSS